MKTIYLLILVLSMSNCTKKQNERNKKAHVMEVVTFTVETELTDSEVRDQLLSLTDFVNGYEGYVARTLGKGDKGEWIDVVYWESLEHAEKAAKKILKDEKALSVFAIINQNTMKFQHFNIQ